MSDGAPHPMMNNAWSLGEPSARTTLERLLAATFHLPVWGGDDPHAVVATHYTDADFSGPILNSYWTTFISDDPERISRNTGIHAYCCRFRYAMRVSRWVIGLDGRQRPGMERWGLMRHVLPKTGGIELWFGNEIEPEYTLREAVPWTPQP